MAYFANGTEGAIFQSRWCSRCRHCREREGDPLKLDGPGCPIWDAHLVGNTGDAKSPVRTVLDMLIAEREDGLKECRMFEPGVPVVMPLDDLDRALGFPIGQQVLPHERVDRVRKLRDGGGRCA